MIDGGDLQSGQAAKVIADFIKDKGLMTLHIIGPKASASDRAHRFGYEAVGALLGLGPKPRNPSRPQMRKTVDAGSGGDRSSRAPSGEQGGDASGIPSESRRSGQRRRRGTGRRSPRKPTDSQPDLT